MGMQVAYQYITAKGPKCYARMILARNSLQVAVQESEFFQRLKASKPFFLMAGPNVIESEAHCLKLARQIKLVTNALGLTLVFKASFDKANRTSATSFRGPGMSEGLR